MVQSMYETNRLYLIQSNEQLAQPIAEYFARNQDFLRDTEPLRTPEFFTEAYQAEEMRKNMMIAASGKGYRFWLSLKTNPKIIIGMVGLNEIVMGAFKSCFLSYRLDAAEINQGYTTEAVARCVRIAFEDIGLHRIEANIMPRNAPSLRVVEKLGFVHEGYAKKYLLINGVWEDHVHRVLINDAGEA